MNIMTIRKKIRPILLSIGFSAIGFGVAFVLKEFLHIKLSKLEISIIAFIITSLSVLCLFPIVFKIPFGKISISDFVKKIGLYIPKKIYKYILLGVLSALLTLSGMLIGSVATGKYIFDISTITLTQAVFSLTPGIWEEVLFRGVIMIVLIRLTNSFKKAFIIQIVLFGLVHIKGFDILAFVDAFSVLIIAIAFTYIAYKTKSLIPGIIFHYLHDTFIFTVQLPDGVYTGLNDNALFYSSLWLSVGLSIIITKRFVERFNISGEYDLYNLGIQSQSKTTDEGLLGKKEKNKKRLKRQLLINSIGFLVILLFSLEESTFLIQLLIGIYILTSLILYSHFDKIKRRIEFPVNILSAFVSFVTGYEYYSTGSKYVYLAWLIIGCFYVLNAFIKEHNMKSSTSVKEA
jgi:membrane protease YdiL (CAAX protease family)